MNANLLICRNEVFIEGINVGQFESFECRADSKTLGGTGVLTLPLYALGTDGTSGSARSRIRTVFITGEGENANSIIRPCALVEVWCWYDSWNADIGANESHERIKVFSGFISSIAEGFPTKLYVQDNSFCLRFGEVQKYWDDATGEAATVQTIINDVLPIAQEAFDAERERLGFTAPVPKLQYSINKQNVQAETNPLSFKEFGGGSPYDVIQRLMTQLVLYGGVDEDFNVYVGAGVTENTRPLITLDTRYNVIGRDIVPVDGRFVDYNVKVTGVLSNGRRYTATGGIATSTKARTQSAEDKALGETYRGYSNMRTVQGIQDCADRLLASLKGFRNKGRIRCLLYPKLKVMDWLTLNDTVFEELSSGYYVLGYQFSATDRGYFQDLEVTDKVFAL